MHNRYVIAGLVFAAAIYQGSQLVGMPKAYRLTLFLPLFVAVLNVLQARQKT